MTHWTSGSNFKLHHFDPIDIHPAKCNHSPLQEQTRSKLAAALALSQGGTSMHPEIIALATLLVMPTHTGTEALAFILRWVHLLAGITWVGLLYFFNLVNVPFMKQVDAGMKPKVFQYMTLPTLQWFRWSALLTVFVGFWYWAQVYVAADARRMGVNPGSTIGLFLLIWIATWGILYFVITRTPSGYVLGVVTTVLVIARKLAVRELHSRGSGR